MPPIQPPLYVHGALEVAAVAVVSSVVVRQVGLVQRLVLVSTAALDRTARVQGRIVVRPQPRLAIRAAPLLAIPKRLQVRLLATPKESALRELLVASLRNAGQGPETAEATAGWKASFAGRKPPLVAVVQAAALRIAAGLARPADVPRMTALLTAVAFAAGPTVHVHNADASPAPEV